ncbi:MAG: cephalosporin hydroxylase family protein [Deltaproteobacteria bacterium]|nr:cephalosporin hydroxylase family protein [Deltaproteobacteria bacterium]
MSKIEFAAQKAANIESMARRENLKTLAKDFIRETAPFQYCYNFNWLGMPIIQFPQDMVAMQEIIWTLKPDLVVETGIARGGSLIFYASLLELIGKGQVIGIDVDVRLENRRAIESHPLSKRIKMLSGSSVDPQIVAEVRSFASDKQCVLVCLDSNHTTDHVLLELMAYSPLVTVGSYIVVFDTIVNDMPDSLFEGKPWNSANNPSIAVRKFLSSTEEFEVDVDIEKKLLITVAPGGYLKRTKRPRN